MEEISQVSNYVEKDCREKFSFFLGLAEQANREPYDVKRFPRRLKAPYDTLLQAPTTPDELAFHLCPRGSLEVVR